MKTAKEYYNKTRLVETTNWTLNMALSFAEEYANQPKWISVEDELPKPKQNVLIYREEGIMVGFFYYSKGRFLGLDNPYGYNDVTYWHPLPENPK